MKTKDYLFIAVFLIAAVALFVFGWYMYPKYNKCPEILSDTVYVHDTVTHNIPDTIPYYIIKHDSIVYHDTIFKDIDTSAILREFYADYYYTRYWSDTPISVIQHDMLSENKFKDSEFSYRLLKPPVVIHNVTNNISYKRYVTIGGSVALKDIKGVNLELMYVTDKYYAKVGYDAYLNSAVIGAGVTIIRLR